MAMEDNVLIWIYAEFWGSHFIVPAIKFKIIQPNKSVQVSMYVWIDSK